MVLYWHVTESGRNKVADAIQSFETNTRMIEKICLTLELVENTEYAKLISSQELKKILHHEKAKRINLHEVVIKDGRLQFRIFCRVDGEDLIFLETQYKNKDGSKYNDSIENAYDRYQRIINGYDKKEGKSIKEFKFYVV